MMIQQAKADDYTSLLSAMNLAFSFDDPSFVPFETLLPDLYKPTHDCMSCHRMIKDAQTVMSSVGIYPIDLQIDDIAMTVAGIGGVATHPDYRGKGCMTAIMQAVCEELYDTGYALSWLSGDRVRYGRFGWETAGSAFELSLVNSGIARPTGEWNIAKVEINAEHVAAFHEQYKQRKVYGVSTAATIQLKLQRHGVELYKATQHDEVAYLAVKCKEREFCEWAGPPEGVLALMLHFMNDKQHWKASISIIRDACTDMLLDRAAHIQHAHNNLAIINLEKLFHIYGPWLKARWPSDLCVTFVMHPVTGETQTVQIANGCVDEASHPSSICVEWGALPMTRLLFGPTPVHLYHATPSLTALQQVFPLPFHVPVLWHV